MMYPPSLCPLTDQHLAFVDDNGQLRLGWHVCPPEPVAWLRCSEMREGVLGIPHARNMLLDKKLRQMLSVWGDHHVQKFQLSNIINGLGYLTGLRARDVTRDWGTC